MAAIRKTLGLELPPNAVSVSVTYKTDRGKVMEYVMDVPIDNISDDKCAGCDFLHWDCDIGDDPEDCSGPHKVDFTHAFGGIFAKKDE